MYYQLVMPQVHKIYEFSYFKSNFKRNFMFISDNFQKISVMFLIKTEVLLINKNQTYIHKTLLTVSIIINNNERFIINDACLKIFFILKNI